MNPDSGIISVGHSIFVAQLKYKYMYKYLYYLYII